MGDMRQTTQLYRLGAVDQLLANLRLEGASVSLVQNSVAALSNFATNPNLRDHLLKNDLLRRLSDLFEVYADVETL